MNIFDLTGKTILITGASSGIGRQIAILVSKHGARVVIAGRNLKRLTYTYENLEGSNHIKINGDLSVQEELESLTDQLPLLNGIVHCAGITNHRPAQFIKQEDIDKIFSINFYAPVLITSIVLKHKKLQKNSSLIFISSVTTQRPYFGGSLYVSAKSALEGYSKVLSLELASRGIRSNCISPGYVKTAMTEESVAMVSQEVMDRVEKEQLLGAGEPKDVANTVLYLLSDESRWITGINLLLGG